MTIDIPEYTTEGRLYTDLVLLLFKANGRLMRAGDQMVRDLDLTSARWQVMGAIVDEPKTVSQIARQYELTRQGVLWVVQAMEKLGLVELIDNPGHRRAKLVRLSKKGQEIYDIVKGRQQIWANEVGSNFTPHQLERMLTQIDKLCQLVAEYSER